MTSFVRQLYRNILSQETRLHLYKLRNFGGYKNLRSSISPSDKGDFSLKPFDDHQCIFVHITKTAGTSVAKGLFDYLPYHYTAVEYRVIYGKRAFDKYFKFAFVRNPWDRLYSAYRYLKSGGWNEEDKIWSETHLTGCNDFKSFVKERLTDKNIMKHIHFMSQHHFICDTNGHLLIDYLAYFETINDDYNKIADKLRIDSKLNHHNASPVASYLSAYNDETRKIVADVYSKDIALFGYEFDKIKHRRVISD